MPIIRIEMFAGRSVEQKRELAASFTATMVAICNVNAEDISIIFEDRKMEDWAFAGKLCADLMAQP